jgi:hypothetical protein
MAVALNDLRGNICRFQSEPLTNPAFDFRIKMGMRAHRPAEFPNPDPFLGLRQPLFRPSEFVKHQGHLEALGLRCDRFPQGSQPIGKNSAGRG